MKSALNIPENLYRSPPILPQYSPNLYRPPPNLCPSTPNPYQILHQPPNMARFPPRPADVRRHRAPRASVRFASQRCARPVPGRRAALRGPVRGQPGLAARPRLAAASGPSGGARVPASQARFFTGLGGASFTGLRGASVPASVAQSLAAAGARSSSAARRTLHCIHSASRPRRVWQMLGSQRALGEHAARRGGGGLRLPQV